MADTNAQALDAALQAGASVEDINNIRGRYGLEDLKTIPQSEAPADFVEQPQGGVLVANTAVQYSEDNYNEPVHGPFVWTEEVKKSPDTNRRNVDAIDAATKASARGQDPVIAYQAVQQDSQYDPDARAEMFMKHTGDSLQDIIGELEQRSAQGEAVEGVLAEKGIHSISASSSEAMAAARAYVASIPTASQLTPKDREDVAFLKYVDFMTAKVADDIGWNWNTVKDVGGFLVPQENLRYNQIAEVLGLDYQDADHLDYTDFLVRTSAYIRSEAPEKRQQMIETLIDAWPEIHGNNRLALVDFLQNIQEGPSEAYRHIESGLERADQSLLTLGVGKFLSGAAKSFKVINTSSKLNNIQALSDAVTLGAQGGLRDVGIQPIDALATLDPSAAVNTLVKGANNTHATEIANTQRDVDVFLEAAGKYNDYGLALTDAEKLAAHDRAVKNLTDRGGISGVEVKNLDEKTFELSFLREDSLGGPPVKFKTTAAYTKDDLTDSLVSVEGKGHINAPKFVTSPNFRFIETKDRQLLVQLPEQLLHQSAYIKGMYDNAITASLKTLSPKEMKGVDYALTKGDEFVDDLGQNVGKVFSRDEAVIDGIEGVRLTDKQYQAYTDIRKVVDHMHYAKNKELIDYYKANSVKFLNWKGDTAPVKAYETASDALKGFKSATSVRSHWVGTDEGSLAFRGAEDLTEDMMQKWYDKGYQLTRATEGRFINSGDTNVEWVFALRKDIREPHGIILNKRTGYMPKIKKDAFYFVKEANDLRVGGAVAKVEKTVRYFDNYTDAAKYTDELNALNPGKYRLLADRELSHSQVDQEFIRAMGGLFTGARSEGVPFGLAGKEGARADSLKSLQRYVSNIARNAPMNLYREGIQQRWLQHAKALGVIPKSYLGSFSEAIHPPVFDALKTSSPFLRDAHAQISFFSGVRTEQELTMLASQRAIARFLERSPIGGRAMSRGLMNSSLDGAVGTIRGLTFHLLLGTYNAAQFIIQASGSLVALSINPIHGAKAVSQLPIYSALDLFVGSPAQKAKLMDSFKKLGFDTEGYEIWNKAGMRESITTSNLDYHSLWSDKPYDAGLLRKALSNDTIFYKNGELISARLAFTTAYHHWKALNPNKPIDIIATKAILARSEMYRLNMTKANSSGFQTGLSSIPTQFLQVQTKFMEKLVGRNELTISERSRLLAAQFALFGAVGVPLGNSLMPHMLDAWNNFFPDEKDHINALNTDPKVLNTLYNGMLGYLIQDWTDVNSVIAGRMALGGDFLERVFSIPSGVVSIPDVAMGAFGTVYDNSKHAIERTWTAFTTVMNADDAKPEDFAAVGQILARSVATLPSSTNNLYKAYDMTNSQFFKNKAGRPVAEWGDINTNTIIAQAVGFAPTEVQDFYELNARPGRVPQIKKATQADRIVRMLADMHNSGDAQQERWNAMAINSIMTTYSRPEDRLELVKQVETKLKEPKDAWGKLMQTVLVDWQSELNTGLAEWHKQVKEKSSPAVARQLAKRGMNRAVAEQQAEQSPEEK